MVAYDLHFICLHKFLHMMHHELIAVAILDQKAPNSFKPTHPPCVVWVGGPDPSHRWASGRGVKKWKHLIISAPVRLRSGVNAPEETPSAEALAPGSWSLLLVNEPLPVVGCFRTGPGKMNPG